MLYFILLLSTVTSVSGIAEALVSRNANHTASGHAYDGNDIQIVQPVHTQDLHRPYVPVCQKSEGSSGEFKVSYKAPGDTQVAWYYTKYDRDGHRTQPRQVPHTTPQCSGSSKETATIYLLNNLAVNDSGNYTACITYERLQRNVTFELHVTGAETKQKVTSEPKEVRFLERNQFCTITCTSFGNYPLTDVTLKWKPCTEKESCETTSLVGNESFILNMTEIHGTYEKGVRLITQALTTFTFYCLDNIGFDGSNPATLEYIVTDIPNSVAEQGVGVQPSGVTQNGSVIEDDHVTLSCMAQKYFYTQLMWNVTFANGTKMSLASWNNRTPVLHSGHYNVTFEANDYSNRLVLHINNASLSHSGRYSCLATSPLASQTQKIAVKRLNITVLAAREPVILNESSPMALVTNYSAAFTIQCKVDGLPFPTITWHKNGVPLGVLPHGILLGQNGQELTFARVVKADEGSYECRAENRRGLSSSRIFQVTVRGAPASTAISLLHIAVLGAVLTLVAIVLVAMIVVVIIQKRKNKQRKALLQELYNELMASAGHKPVLNPSKLVNEQLSDLPYDPRYEIAKELLEITNQKLGDGEFGIVKKGTLYCNSTKMAARNVAVKAPKSGLDVSEQKALLSELKMFIYIGHHVNVLSLVGAVTKQMAMGELYVVMELCEHSLLDHLKKHKQHKKYVNEVVVVHPDVPTCTASSEEAYLTPSSQEGYLVPNAAQRCATSYKALSDPDWLTELAEMRRSVRGSVIATSNLLFYAYQVASGMEYLAAKNLIHRDLAARNVLLTSDDIAKISDFGLARQEEIYSIKNAKNTRLPWKWTALESMETQNYTVQSDVWSFGVLLWEIFSLGSFPYPGIVNADLLQYLRRGHRMSAPDEAPDVMSQMMSQCWLSEPNLRPTFSECKQLLAVELKRCLGTIPQMFDQFVERLTTATTYAPEYHFVEFPPTVQQPRRAISNRYTAVPTRNPDKLLSPRILENANECLLDPRDQKAENYQFVLNPVNSQPAMATEIGEF